jgi:hypothetical protein
LVLDTAFAEHALVFGIFWLGNAGGSIDSNSVLVDSDPENYEKFSPTIPLFDVGEFCNHTQCRSVVVE